MNPSTRRSLLFVPGSRPERFAKALDSGADLVCVDLEDAVGAGQKTAARTNAAEFLQQNSAAVERIVRINTLRSRAGLEDLLALLDAQPSDGIVFLPKVDSADELRLVDDILGREKSPLKLAALVETLTAVEAVDAIARATPRLTFLMLGGVDLAGQLGVPLSDPPLAYARSRLVYASKRAGVDSFDLPTLSFRDPEAVRRDAELARQLGFTGKAVLHPSNVSVVNLAYTPSAAEVDHARRVLRSYKDSGGGVSEVDGRLVEAPVVKAMQAVLARAPDAIKKGDG